MQKCLNGDPEKRPDTLDLLEELHIFTESPLRKRQFEAADSSASLQTNLSSAYFLPPPSPPHHIYLLDINDENDTFPLFW